MIGFKLRTSGMGNDRSTNWATTTAHHGHSLFLCQYIWQFKPTSNVARASVFLTELAVRATVMSSHFVALNQMVLLFDSFATLCCYYCTDRWQNKDLKEGRLIIISLNFFWHFYWLVLPSAVTQEDNPVHRHWLCLPGSNQSALPDFKIYSRKY